MVQSSEIRAGSWDCSFHTFFPSPRQGLTPSRLNSGSHNPSLVSRGLESHTCAVTRASSVHAKYAGCLWHPDTAGSRPFLPASELVALECSCDPRGSLLGETETFRTGCREVLGGRPSNHSADILSLDKDPEAERDKHLCKPPGGSLQKLT